MYNLTPSRGLNKICILNEVPTLRVEDSKISPDSLVDLFGFVESADQTPEYLFIHPSRAKELIRKKFAKKEMNCIGHLWGVEIYITKKIDKNSVYLIGVSPYFGDQNEIARVIFRRNSWWNSFKKKVRAWLGRE